MAGAGNLASALLATGLGAGGRAAIGRLEELSGVVDGTAGTQIRASGPEVEYRS